MTIRVSQRRVDMGGAQMRFSKGANVTAASALVITTDGNYFDVDGATTITSISSIVIGTVIKLHFNEALTLTHHATDLILPGGANITTAAGDEAEFIQYADGDWRCVSITNGSVTATLTNKTIDGDSNTISNLPYDIAFVAGFDSTMVKENIAVQTYGELVMSRTGSFVGEAGYIDTAATGAAAIVDILKNAVTVYTTKPQFAISANTLTAGTLKTDGTEDFVSGDRITFKVTQIGSSTVGQGIRFTAKAKV